MVNLIHTQLGLISLCFLLGISQFSSAQSPATEGVEVRELIYGAGSDVEPGLFGSISDPNYQDIIGATAHEIMELFSDVEFNNVITLGVSEKYEGTIIDDYELMVSYSVIPYDLSESLLPNSNIDFVLSTSYENGSMQLENYKAAHKISGFHKVEVNITSIQIDWLSDQEGFVDATELPANAYVEAYFIAERAYAFNHDLIPGDVEGNYNTAGNFVDHQFLQGLDDTNIADNSFDGISGIDDTDIRITWDHIDGAEFYELEWAYVNNYGLIESAYIDADEMPLSNRDFKKNSSRISTNCLHYDIPLTFERG